MPPLLPRSEESIITGERLRLLGLGYYISGGIGAFFASFLLIYAIMFGALSFIPESDWIPEQTQRGNNHPQTSNSEVKERPKRPSGAPPVIFFRIFSIVMLGATCVGWILAGLTAYAGYCIRSRKHRIFTNVMAAYNVIWIPYGTLLGVLTFIVVNSAEAIRQYEEK